MTNYNCIGRSITSRGDRTGPAPSAGPGTPARATLAGTAHRPASSRVRSLRCGLVATTLGKGANTALPPDLTRARIVLGWSGGPDLDASALLLTGSGKVRGDTDFVFYNQPRSTDGSVVHRGKSGREDTLVVDLAALPAEIETVALAASTDGAP